MTQVTAAGSTRPQTGIRDHVGFLWRFVRFALPFWSAEHKWMNRGRLALIAALTVAQVAVQVGLNSWSARLYNAIEGRHLEAFLELIVTFVLLLLASILVFSITLSDRRPLSTSVNSAQSFQRPPSR
jgi:putative ATP-binding cassette transporter